MARKEDGRSVDKIEKSGHIKVEERHVKVTTDRQEEKKERKNNMHVSLYDKHHTLPALS